MNITFATCWYNLKSKFDVNTYRQWMGNFLMNVNNFNLVIYTNKESYYVLELLVVNNSKIKVIFKEWEEFYGYQWRDNWINNHKNNNLLNDKSRFNTDWKLNMLWSEKINFVKEIMDKKYPKREVFPKNDDFGITAWTYCDYNEAIEKYNELESI